MRPIAEPYRKPFEQFLGALANWKARDPRQTEHPIISIVEEWAGWPGSFLADTPSGRDWYRALADLIDRGRAAVVYGDLFSWEMPDLIAGAMATFANPIRVFNMSNALDWAPVPTAARVRGIPASTPLLQLLAGPWVSPEGHFLMTYPTGHGFDYRRLEVREAVRLAVESGGLVGWSQRLRADEPTRLTG